MSTLALRLKHTDKILFTSFKKNKSFKGMIEKYNNFLSIKVIEENNKQVERIFIDNINITKDMNTIFSEYFLELVSNINKYLINLFKLTEKQFFAGNIKHCNLKNNDFGKCQI